jgi:hypothetical protein
MLLFKQQVNLKLLYLNSSSFAHLVPIHLILLEKSGSSFDGDLTEALEAIDSRPLWRKILFSFAALIIVSAAIGAALGVGLGEDGIPDEVVAWVALPGLLFVRAIRCCVIPLIFVTMVLSMIEMLEVGQASSVGWKTIVVYLATTCVAATIGVLLSTAFATLFSDGTSAVAMTSKLIKLGCNSGQDGYVMQ